MDLTWLSGKGKPYKGAGKSKGEIALKARVEPRAAARVTRTVRSYAIGVVRKDCKKDCKSKRHKDGRMLQSSEEEPMENPPIGSLQAVPLCSLE
eukprot:2235305-Amphidinium_carterae.1